MVVVDKVAQDAAIRERHGEVLHLHTHTQAERDFIYRFQLEFSENFSLYIYILQCQGCVLWQI